MEIPLTVLETAGVARRAAHVVSGVPLTRGMARSAEELDLRAEDGTPLHCQYTPLNRWPDGSIKWVLLDFRLSLNAGSCRRVVLAVSTRPAVFPRTPMLKLRDDGERFHFNTHGVRLDVPKHAAAWVADVGVGRSGKIGMLSAPELRLQVTDAGHRKVEVGATVIDGAALERAGREHVVVCKRGRVNDVGGERLFDLVQRIHVFADTTRVQVETTLTQRSRHAVLLARDYSLLFAAPACAEGAYLFGGDKGAHGGQFVETPTRHLTPDERSGWKTAALVQRSESAYTVASSFVLGEERGARAPGWVDIAGPEFGLMLAVRHFWEQHPLTLTARGDGAVEVGLCPPQSDTPYRFERGSAKTFEFMLDFHRGARSPEECQAAWADFQHPLFAVADPEWYAETGAFGAMTPFDPVAFPEYDMADKLRGPRYQPAPPFGSRHYGDQLFGGTAKGQYAFVNLEYDTPLQDFHRFARTGSTWYLQRGLLGASHQSDVDTNHVTGEQLRHSALHTTWMPDLGHVTLGGLIFSYLLTGRRRLLETALEIGDWLCGEMNNYISGFGSGRHIGWPLIALNQLYRETGERRFLEAAGKLVAGMGAVQTPTGDFACIGEGSNDIHFFCGLAAIGAAEYAELAGDEAAAETALRHVRYYMGLYPEYAGRNLPALIWAYGKTGDETFVDFAARTYETGLLFSRDGVNTFVHPYLAHRRARGDVGAAALSVSLPRQGLAHAPERHGQELAARDEVWLRWSEGGRRELLIQRLRGDSAGEAVLFDAAGKALGQVRFAPGARLWAQQDVLAFEAWPNETYRLTTRNDAADDTACWQVWCAQAWQLVRFSGSRAVLAPVFYLPAGVERFHLLLEARDEGYKSAVVYDPMGWVVLAAHDYINLRDGATHRAEHTVWVDADGPWRVELHGYRACVPEALPFFARSEAAWFVPDVDAAREVAAR